MSLLTLIKASSGRIFGGFLSKMHVEKGDDEWINDPSAFIFSVSDCKRFPIKSEKVSGAFFNHKDCGPTFGGLHDIYLA